MTLSPSTTDPPRWLHRWAVLTVCATVVLLALGSIVTTFRVGMADPVWPTYPWHLLLISWQEPRPGFLIEHTHRLAGYIVGCCVIVLAAGLWWAQSRRWLSWLGVAALAGVIVQGLLGGFRVRLHALVGTDLALIHGVFAQVVFALLVSLAVFTSPAWSAESAARPADLATLRRWSLVTTGVVFAQLVFGAVLRHTHSPLGQRGHLLTAFAVVAAVVWLGKLVRDGQFEDSYLSGATKLLMGLLVLQLLLGVEAWVLKFSGGGLADLRPVTTPQALVRTAHVLVGSWILATAVVAALGAHRRSFQATAPVVASLNRLEGAA